MLFCYRFDHLQLKKNEIGDIKKINNYLNRFTVDFRYEDLY